MNPIKKLQEERSNLFGESETMLNTAIKQSRQISAAEDLRLIAIRNRIFDIDAEIAKENLKLQAASHSRSHGLDMDMQAYSIVRAINGAGNGRLDGYELEVSQEISRRSGKNPSGFYVPNSALIERRDMTATGGSNGDQGGLAIGTNVLGILEALRPMSRVIAAGATVFSGLSSNISIPRQSAATTATWKAENAELDEASPVLDQVSLQPNRVGAFVELSNQLLIQSVESVEAFIRRDLLGAIATAVDYAAVNGTGLTNQPLGILATPGIGDVVGGTDGLAPTWAHICQLVGLVADANADFGSLAYLMNSKLAAKLRSSAKVASTDSRMILEGNTLLDYPVHFSNNVPSNLDKGSSTGVCSALIFGNFADVLIAQFGLGVDLIVDRYSKATTGITRVIANSYVDVALRRVASFAAMKDALTA